MLLQIHIYLFIFVNKKVDKECWLECENQSFAEIVKWNWKKINIILFGLMLVELTSKTPFFYIVHKYFFIKTMWIIIFTEKQKIQSFRLK